MRCRRATTVVFLLAMLVFGPGSALAATPTLSSSPPSTFSPPPRPHRTHTAAPAKPKPAKAAKPVKRATKPRPKPKPAPSPVRTRTTHTTATLPMTGADLPLELAVGAALVACGALAGAHRRRTAPALGRTRAARRASRAHERITGARR